MDLARFACSHSVSNSKTSQILFTTSIILTQRGCKEKCIKKGGESKDLYTLDDKILLKRSHVNISIDIHVSHS